MVNDALTDGLDIAFLLWAKTDRETDRWHALPYHLIDVGATASLLWDYLSAQSQSIAADAFGDATTAKRHVIFLAAAHDIGKANRFFQAKDSRQLKRLAPLKIVRADEPRKHGQATSALLFPWISRVWGWDQMAAGQVAVAVGGHHGIFQNQLDQDRLHLNGGYVPEATSALLEALSDLYETTHPVPEPTNLNVFLAWLAGFVSVADWLGSNEDMTVWRNGPCDLGDYATEAEGRARDLFVALKWSKPGPGAQRTIYDIVPEGCEPNELQLIAEIVGSQNFGLAVVESPTGEGKTEAAFALAEPGRAAGAGIYVALPTMATANGIYDRVHRYLADPAGASDLDLRLLHSQSWLYRENVTTISNPDRDEQQDVAEDWFSGGKRGLLAPYGVGTIDQGLVAALRAKHGFVRLYALAGKTVVVDEVHAYDVYMSDLLDRLLGWLKALGCRVILLSATLPAARRRALVAAWGGAIPEPSPTYPCVTWVDSAGAGHSRMFGIEPRKPVTYQLVDSKGQKAWEAGTEKVAELAGTSGGFAALILNTVKDAQAAYKALRNSVGARVEVDLFHARYTMEDRADKERAVLTKYGKQGRRGKTRILVGTQVIEQSLDLDFDHMVSALAPIDLLIQRAGRLHRHKRDGLGCLKSAHEPDGRPMPTIHILEPSIDEFGVPHLVDRVYAHDVLLKTHAFLHPGFVVREPGDVSRAVDHVYDRASQEADRSEWQERFEAATTRADAARLRNHALAEDAMICGAVGWGLITERPNGFDENDDAPGSEVAARTRLEELPSANLVIIRSTDPWPPARYDKLLKRSLVLRTVRTPAYGACLEELNALPKPANWDRSGASKYAIPIEFGHDDWAQTPSFKLHYDMEYGLEIMKNNAEL